MQRSMGTPRGAAPPTPAAPFPRRCWTMTTALRWESTQPVRRPCPACPLGTPATASLTAVPYHARWDVNTHDRRLRHDGWASSEGGVWAGVGNCTNAAAVQRDRPWHLWPWYSSRWRTPPKRSPASTAVASVSECKLRDFQCHTNYTQERVGHARR